MKLGLRDLVRILQRTLSAYQQLMIIGGDNITGLIPHKDILEFCSGL
jgi:hypothetical protein